ncbi:dipeptide epimerase [Algibacter sp. 2305UL17-15]|uniref:dipeptide epimerase n=1 Tax=Algibacter sp. 2305UL17-15 TaxID=3231268 RepID=UPI003459ADAC
MKLKITPTKYQLKLKDPFTTSRYTVTVQDTMIVSISNGEITGYGEATVNPYYGSTVENLEHAIKSVSGIVKKGFGVHPTDLWTRLEPKLRKNYFALCAIDCAYWDFYAKLNKKTLRSFWSNDDTNIPMTNYTIGIDEIFKMKSKIIENTWPIYKIKLGTSEDVNIIKALRKITDAVFRIDANCAWGTDETINKSKALKDLGVEFIEQPLRADDWGAMTIIKETSALPIIADESCQRLGDVEKCAETFHGINIKLMKCGGITPALKMIQKARDLNLKVMAGCMTESTIGISSLVQIAPLLDYIDADGAMLLETDIASGVGFKDGHILFADGFGSGVELKTLNL